MKKGMSQIDWAISMALFLLLIAWFFAFLQPMMQTDISKKSMMTSLSSSFASEFTEETLSVPIVIFSEKRDFLPIIIDFTYGWDQFSLSTGEPYLKTADKLFFLVNMTGDTDAVWLVRDANTTRNSAYGLASGTDWATTTKLFRMNQIPSLDSRLFLNSTLRLTRNRIYADRIQVEPTETSYESSAIAAVYQGNIEGLNHTIAVYAMNSIADIIAMPKPGSSYLYEMKFSALGYHSYFSDNIHFGRLNATSARQNLSFTADYLNLYDDREYAAVFLDRASTIYLEYYNTTIDVNISFQLGNTSISRLELGWGNFTNASRGPYSSMAGAARKERGLDLAEIRGSDYSSLKERWNYPDDFSVTIYRMNETEPIISIGPEADSGQVYAIDEYRYAIDDGMLIPVVVNMRVW